MEIVEYPKMIYREPGGERQMVNGPDEEAALKEEWGLVESEPVLPAANEAEEEAVEVMPSGEEVTYKISELRPMNKARLLEMVESHGISFAPEEVTKDDLINILMDLNP